MLAVEASTSSQVSVTNRHLQPQTATQDDTQQPAMIAIENGIVCVPITGRREPKYLRVLSYSLSSRVCISKTATVAGIIVSNPGNQTLHDEPSAVVETHT